jgi:hypothetical protein
LPNYIIDNDENYIYLNKNLENWIDWNKLFPSGVNKLAIGDLAPKRK